MYPKIQLSTKESHGISTTRWHKTERNEDYSDYRKKREVFIILRKKRHTEILKETRWKNFVKLIVLETTVKEVEGVRTPNNSKTFDS